MIVLAPPTTFGRFWCYSITIFITKYNRIKTYESAGWVKIQIQNLHGFGKIAIYFFL